MIEVRCVRCGAGFRAGRPGKARCLECGQALTIRQERQERPVLTVKREGFIPWAALDDDVRALVGEARGRVAGGRGPGSSLNRFTKAVGIKPCGGCERRAAWMDGAGWFGLAVWAALLSGVGLGVYHLVRFL